MAIKYDNEVVDIPGTGISLLLFGKDGTALIDTHDRDKVEALHWHLSGAGYVESQYRAIERKKRPLLHSFLADAPKGMVVDHVNRDKMDNRRENLRVCTQSQNLCNSKIRSDNKTGCKGVTYIEARRKYSVRMKVDGEYKHFGQFDQLSDAVAVAETVRNQHHGEFACHGA